MAKIQRVKVGDPVTAEIWNAIVDKLRPFTKIAVSQGSYLNYTTGPHGTNLSLAIPRATFARLSGSSSPYSWTAVVETASGATLDRTAGLTGGASNLYELNGKSGLGGKVVPIEWTSAGDWRFQYVGYGCHLGPCANSIPEVLSFEDVYFGITMAAIWTPDNPAVPCGDGGWVAYNLLDYPGSGGGPGHCATSCPPGDLAMRYRLTFVSGLPVMTISTKASLDGCPNLTGTIPDGPWTASITWGRISWSCTPTFSASYRLDLGSTIYDCHTYPSTQILVTTPP